LDFFPRILRTTKWLFRNGSADDLGVQVGDAVSISYFVMGERRNLEERTRSFRVRDISESGKSGWDGSWMPDFPGLADVGNCRDWKPGFALSLDRIRDKDEVYWKQFRGTPKAFVSLKVGQEMWANRWGRLSSIRYPKGDVSEGVILKSITPADIGFQFLPLRDLAFSATNAPVDFAGLFGGFSFFLILASLALVSLLFGLMVEKRGNEAGTLIALGWSKGRVRLLFLGEGFITVVLGGVLGGFAGLLYTRAILAALANVWKGATAGVEIGFYAAPVLVGCRDCE